MGAVVLLVVQLRASRIEPPQHTNGHGVKLGAGCLWCCSVPAPATSAARECAGQGSLWASLLQSLVSPLTEMSVAISALALYQWKREDVVGSDGTSGWVSRHREPGWPNCSVGLGKVLGLQLCAARGSGAGEMPAVGGYPRFPCPVSP